MCAASLSICSHSMADALFPGDWQVSFLTESSTSSAWSFCASLPWPFRLEADDVVRSGVGLKEGWPWQVVIIIGFGGIGLSTASLPTIAITYAVDCVRPFPRHTFAAVANPALAHSTSPWRARFSASPR